MADKDYYSFEEVLRDLEMEEDELKRLVSAGEIRAFRERDTMRFKAGDIERLRSSGEDVEELELEDLDLDDELEMGEELVLEDEDEAQAEDLLELDEDAESLELEEAGVEPGGVEEIDLAAVAEGAPRGARRAGALPGPRRGSRAQAAMSEQTEGVGTLAMLIFGFVAMLLANFLILDAASGRSSNALTKAFADFFR